MRSTILVLLIAVSASGNLYAQESQIDRRFRQRDRDGDGKLSKNELPQNVRGNFDRVDSDKDGSISLREHRQFLGRRRRNVDTAGALPDTLIHHRDLPYADTDNPRQCLDLIVPKDASSESPLPLVAFIHGGGWRNGHKNAGLRQVTRFADSGKFVAASIGYRLSGEATWPAQIHDCKAAIRWLKGNAAKFNIDPKRICVFGSSAGGHLVAMLGVSADVDSLEGKLGRHLDQSSRVSAVIDFFGPTNFLTMNDHPGNLDHDSDSSPESLLIGGAIQKNKERAMAAVPVSYVSKDDAPILIMHGTKDPLVPFDQSVQFHRKLRAAGIDATLVPITDGEHGFRGAAIDNRVDRFLDKMLLGKDVEIPSAAISL